MKQNIIFIFVFLYLFVDLQAQQHACKFERITMKEGLSHSVIYDIIQDKQGFLWLSTHDGGLNKYDGYKFTIYKNDIRDSTSISGNSINKLALAPDGRLWIGTWGSGINVYDPESGKFKSFINKGENSISGNKIQTVFIDNKGIIWIGTFANGLNRYDSNENKFKSYKSLPDNSTFLSDDRVWDICQENDTTFWVATESGLNRFNPEIEVFTNIFHSHGDIHLANEQIRCLLIDSSGKLWIGTPQGIVLYVLKKNTYSMLLPYPTEPKGSQKNKINDIFEDMDGNIWVGTQQGGLNLYLPSQNGFYHYLNNSNDESSISLNDIRTIYQDKTGILWIGTRGGGINKLNFRYKKFYHYKSAGYASSSPEGSDRVIALDEDLQGNIWVGMEDNGVSVFDPKNEKLINFNSYSKGKHLNSHRIRTIMTDNEGKIWIGTDDKGVSVFDIKTGELINILHKPDNNNSLTDNEVTSMLQDAENIIWLGTKNGLNRFDPKTKQIDRYLAEKKGFADNRIISLFEDSKNNLWIGTDKGLSKFEKSGKISNYYHKPGDFNSLSNNHIYTIAESIDGDIWIGTANGLNRLNIENNIFEIFNERNNLPGNAIYGILQDKNEFLWISTNKGLSKLNINDKKISNFGAHDGLQSDEFILGAYCKTTEGEFYYGGVNGFNRFFPDSIKPNPFAPEVVFTDFQLFNKTIKPGLNSKLSKTIDYTHKINLTYRDYVFSLSFAALHFAAPDKNTYAYMLEGLDNEWIQTGNRHFITYTTLPAGKYKLKVKAANSDEIWGKASTIDLIITPPFWKQLWFYIVVGILVLFGIIAFIRIRTQKLRKHKERLEKLVRERTFEIIKQKEEIEAQRDQAQRQKKEITDSIMYAKRIQRALFPPSNYIKQLVSEHFILNKPRDIVSGDFYWVTQLGDKIIIAVADCTGHGVPGAFMSMLGISFLNEIRHRNENNGKNDKNKVDTITAGDILNELRNHIKRALHQESQSRTARDGMDIALCTIDTTKRELQFSGAYNPFLLIRNQEMIIIKADKMPIGIFVKQFDKPFTNHKIQLHKGDVFYLFTDGYVDQFGGPKGRKFLFKHFKSLLQEISSKPLSKQKVILNDTIENWKGEDYRQIDDILILGIRIE